MYINGAAAISVQKPLSDEGIFSPVELKPGYAKCQDPSFALFVKPIEARRMSSVVKRAIAVSKSALEQAGLTVPDAIITGTGVGCFEDTDGFISGIIDNNETMLKPSLFINSTPNTIGSQVAISLGCHGYNNTHVHNSAAFGGALLDAWMLLQGADAHNVLLGAGDECNEKLYLILKNLGLNAKSALSEGSVGIIISDCKSENCYACVDAVESSFLPDTFSAAQKQQRMRSMADAFLARNGLSFDTLDLVVTGRGEEKLINSQYDFIPSSVKQCVYKKLCGEYVTSSAYGFYVTACLIRKNFLPACLAADGIEMPGGLDHVLYAMVWESRYVTFVLMSRICTN